MFKDRNHEKFYGFYGVLVDKCWQTNLRFNLRAKMCLAKKKDQRIGRSMDIIIGGIFIY